MNIFVSNLGVGCGAASGCPQQLTVICPVLWRGCGYASCRWFMSGILGTLEKRARALRGGDCCSFASDGFAAFAKFLFASWRYLDKDDCTCPRNSMTLIGQQ